MGKVGSKIAHPFKNFNVEGRAHQIISKEKPTPAPKHKSDEVNVDNLIKGNTSCNLYKTLVLIDISLLIYLEYPDIYEESLKKNESLDKHLRDVYVKSHDPDVSIILNKYLFGINQILLSRLNLI